MAKFKTYYNLDNFFDHFYGPLFGVQLSKVEEILYVDEDGSLYSDIPSPSETRPIMSFIYEDDEKNSVKTKIKRKITD